MAEHTGNKREAQVINEIRRQFFAAFDTSPMLGDIDFAVAMDCGALFYNNDGSCKLPDDERNYFLWAEAKRGENSDIYASLIQLILTIGRAKTYQRYPTPKYLGAFDNAKIAFVEYERVEHIFVKRDFNWNVKASDHSTKEFKELDGLLRDTLSQEVHLFRLSEDNEELCGFIRTNFKSVKGLTRGKEVTRNNFVAVFHKWCVAVLPYIKYPWDKSKKEKPREFFTADLISRNDLTCRDGLQVALEKNKYIILREEDEIGLVQNAVASFVSEQGIQAYREFWSKYKRPPKEEAITLILDRQDLLMLDDVREYTGAFYTPPLWVQKSQEYIADVLGEKWQQEYYVWDCAAGSGNLLSGLTEPARIWASTLELSDTQVMKTRAKESGLPLLKDHVFAFDFLNDSFDELPDTLKEIVNTPEKRKHLVMYINPPFGEGDSREGAGRTGIAKTKTQTKYADFMGYGRREVFVQFLTRIYKEIPGCIIANFSKLKGVQSPNFVVFRHNFRAKLQRLFVVPSKTFDNVGGNWPLGFFIWDTKQQETFNGFYSDVYDHSGKQLPSKYLHNYDGKKVINDWIKSFRDTAAEKSTAKEGSIATAIAVASDFQHQRTVCLDLPNKPWNHQFQWQITINNLLPSCVAFAVRLIPQATWQNDLEQFLWPKDTWMTDNLFVSDCFVLVLFNGKNNIKSAECVNNWIPFTEKEIRPRDSFASHFMLDFLNGKRTATGSGTTGEQTFQFDGEQTSGDSAPVVFSPEATAVFDAGRELWRYYHKQPGAVPDASYYDIRRHFQGEKKNKQGVAQMCPDSGADATYTALLGTLRQRMKALAARIEPKIYEHGFLLPETQA